MWFFVSFFQIGIAQKKNRKIGVKLRNERLISEWTKVIVVKAARTVAAWKVADPEEQKLFEKEIPASSVRATEIQDDPGTSPLNAEEPALYPAVLARRKAYTGLRNAQTARSANQRAIDAAGIASRGGAVVATQVRKLPQRSSQAAPWARWTS